MTIQEAIKSGKPFHHKGYPLEIYRSGEFFFTGQYRNPYLFSRSDIIADDWEVKP